MSSSRLAVPAVMTMLSGNGPYGFGAGSEGARRASIDTLTDYLRFMGWLNTNFDPGYYGDAGHHLINWADRSLPTDVYQGMGTTIRAASAEQRCAGELVSRGITSRPAAPWAVGFAPS